MRPARLGRSLLPLLISSGFFGIKASAQSLLAKFVVELALFRIAEDLMGCRNFFEFFFGDFIAWIDIRMIFSRQLSVSFPNVLGAGRPLYAQRLIIISCRHFLRKILR